MWVGCEHHRILSLKGWDLHLWGVFLVLNEKPCRGGVAPVETLLCHATTSTQLQVTTTDILLKFGYRIQSNILLPVPNGISQGQTVDWTWP